MSTQALYRLVFLITMTCLSHKLHSKDTYPYQEPHRFNQKYQKSNYYLADTLYFYTNFLPDVAKNKHFETTSPLVNPNKSNNHLARFTPNTSYNLFSLFYKKGADEECKPYTLPKQFSANARVIFSSPDMGSYPLILVHRTNDDKIVVYVANPKKKNLGGSKLTFNIDAFERYMKTTAWYNTRPELGEKIQERDSAILFGFAINADDFNFSVPEPLAQSFSISFAEIQGAWKFATCDDRYQFIRSLYPFEKTVKEIINGKSIYNSYKDLTTAHTLEWQGKSIKLPASITIEKMNQNDFQTFEELLKQGNSN